MNSSFIALIPKTLNLQEVKYFRPISLINSSLKIFTKILPNRLSPMMVDIVDDFQNEFIKGRQAAESILIVKEVFHSLKEGKKRGFILKILRKLLTLWTKTSFFTSWKC